jgi:hypothetical protein
MLNQQAVTETWTTKMQREKAWDAPGAAHLWACRRPLIVAKVRDIE